MEPDLDKLNRYTGVNYMKRSDKSGSSVISSSQKTISHDIGYAPKFLYFVDLYNDGMLWYGGERVFEGTDSTSYYPPPPLVDAWVSVDSITFQPYDVPSSRPVHWLLYLDYGV